MKIISTYLAGIKTSYNVYENVAEFEQSGHKLVSPSDAEPGDYILTDNGYYVPVLKRSIFKPKKRNRSTLKLTVPRRSFIFNYDNDKGITGRYQMVYDLNTKRIESKYLSIRAKAFANFLVNGIDLITAFKTAYASRRDLQFSLHNLLEADLTNPKFYEYLRSIGFMPKESKLNKAGLDEDFLLEQLKGIISNPDEPHQLRKFALETAFRLHEINKAPSSGRVDYGNNLAEKVNGLIEKAIPKNLPEPVPVTDEQTSAHEQSSSEEVE